MRTELRRWTTTTAALALTLVTAGAGSATTTGRAAPDGAPAVPGSAPEARVDGTGGGVLEGVTFGGDRVTFHVDAAAPHDKPWLGAGEFEVTHLRADGSLLSHFGGDVTCVIAGDGVAVATGVVEWREGPGIPGQDPLGVRVGLTVQDHGRRDRLGWSWWVTGFRDAPHCMSTAPFFAVTEGAFRVDTPRPTP